MNWDPQADLARFHKDAQHYETHRMELLQRYPEQWVAIFNEQVVAVNPDYEALLDEIQEKGIPVGQVFIQRATVNDELLLLPG